MNIEWYLVRGREVTGRVMFAEAPSFSIGMVVRDDRGKFLRGKCMKIEGRVSVFEAESVVVCEALSWIM